MPEKVFIEAQDVKQMAAEVLEAHPDLSYIHIDDIKFLAMEGRAGNKIAYVKGLREDLAMLSRYKYILCVIEGPFNLLGLEDKAKVIHHELLHIHPEFNGKTVPHDVMDFHQILATYGLDYLPQGVSRGA